MADSGSSAECYLNVCAYFNTVTTSSGPGPVWATKVNLAGNGGLSRLAFDSIGDKQVCSMLSKNMRMFIILLRHSNKRHRVLNDCLVFVTISLFATDRK